jgi:hypothetical protein
MVYVVVLLLVIIGSNAPLRGLASLAGLLALLVTALLLAYFDVWDTILERIGALHVEISVAGYLVPSVVLLVAWLVAVFGFDRLRNVRYCVVRVAELMKSRQVSGK